ncbi:Mss4-like protein [Crassisporium funariophilum]|nr:Mss4-like protein [Crassisporium funariophilum]
MSSPPSSAPVRSGSCLCKSIKYEIYGDPITFRVCHCANCRKASGSAFLSNIFFDAKNVRVLQGDDYLKSYRDCDTASGSPLDRYFCTECGSNVFLGSVSKAGSSLRIVTMGTLDTEVEWLPHKELFPEQKRKWVEGINISSKVRAKL